MHGDLVTMWRCSSFELTSFTNGTNYRIIECMWKEGGRKPITVVNVYEFGTLCDKTKVWQEIVDVMVNQVLKPWCVFDGF